jgi:hypothetical protein
LIEGRSSKADDQTWLEMLGGAGLWTVTLFELQNVE